MMVPVFSPLISTPFKYVPVHCMYYLPNTYITLQEYNKRPPVAPDTKVSRRYHPRHVVHPSTLTLQECLALSDVVVSAVPDAKYKVKTEWLKDGCVCLNVAADKNFDKDVRDKVRLPKYPSQRCIYRAANSPGVFVHPRSRKSNHPYASS
jgi:hypothetical protein